MKPASIKGQITIIIIFFILLCVGLSYAAEISEKSQNAAGGTPPSTDIDINLSGRILLPRSDANGTMVSNFAAEIYLKKPGNVTEYAVSNKNDGSFKFSPFALKRGNSNFTLEAKANGYSNWSQSFTPTSDMDYGIYTTLKPGNDFLFIICMMPAILGLIIWITIRGSRRFGRTISVFIIANYFLVLLIWMTQEGTLSDMVFTGAIPGFKMKFIWAFLSVLLLEVLAVLLKPIVWPHLESFGKWAHIIKQEPVAPSSGSGDKTVGQEEETCGQSRRLNAIWLVATVTALWVLTIVSLFYANVRYGANTITLFNPDLSIPFYIPIASFLGILVYAATNIRDSFAFGDFTSVFRNKQLALGERILIGPYIAIIAYLMLFRLVTDQIKPISTGYGALVAALAFAFFTGLFVKPVLSYLEKLAVKMLPLSDQIELLERDEANEDLTDLLGLSDTMALELQGQNISKIETLKDLTDDDMNRMFDKFETVSIGQLIGARHMAKLYLKEIRALKDILKLKPEHIDDLKSNQAACIRRISILNENTLKDRMESGISLDLNYIIKKAEAVTTLYDELREIELINSSKSCPKISKIAGEFMGLNLNYFKDIYAKLLNETKESKSDGEGEKIIFIKTDLYNCFEAIGSLRDKMAVGKHLAIKEIEAILADLEQLGENIPVRDLNSLDLFTLGNILSIPSGSLQKYKTNVKCYPFIEKVIGLREDLEKSMSQLDLKDVSDCKKGLKAVSGMLNNDKLTKELREMNIKEFGDVISSDALSFLKIVDELTSEQKTALKDIKLKDLADYFSI